MHISWSHCGLVTSNLSLTWALFPEGRVWSLTRGALHSVRSTVVLTIWFLPFQVDCFLAGPVVYYSVVCLVNCVCFRLGRKTTHITLTCFQSVSHESPHTISIQAGGSIGLGVCWTTSSIACFSFAALPAWQATICIHWHRVTSSRTLSNRASFINPFHNWADSSLLDFDAL